MDVGGCCVRRAAEIVLPWNALVLSRVHSHSGKDGIADCGGRPRAPAKTLRQIDAVRGKLT